MVLFPARLHLPERILTFIKVLESSEGCQLHALSASAQDTPPAGI
jgi:hypothetical protein